ncbi:formyltetrahydrofolate deformylase [Flexivirga endophytica]|uniref:Formyltetrahydrofolate deformylase n=1 Tax=Flexivirga endophytica TaxID=1849103 RepID=A0A916WPJ9_9MICO|nr:formyltetrahydrofolate deformylase [Flexivirga endophytica]GGB17659.1 formyltetrahydrofolate deformylase [Flexivirga endophytica]GHB37990.1 formyltetrahydrofolate deformylase [Flexivirga endophytica]
MSQRQSYVFTASCPDGPGIIAAISTALVGHDANIDECQQFGDALTGQFFIRAQVHGPVAEQTLRESLLPVAQRFGMTWGLFPAEQPTRALVLVSKLGHCLNDLLYRQQVGSLPIDIVAVGSNHLDFQKLVSSHDIPFHHIPVTRDSKDAAESRLTALIDESGADLVILARYMQVLSPQLCERLAGRAINIHHSFLPSFRGARPYHQAHERGVKLIGATAHYVTPDLDEGPIIEQDVARIDHGYSPADMVVAGRDVEAQVLARAVTWHAEHRVFPNGSSTVVLR